MVDELAASMRFPAHYKEDCGDLEADLIADASRGSDFSAEERIVMECLADGAIRGTDEIAALTNLAGSDLASTLTALELKRAIARRPDGTFEIH